jgi:hypothetical protein
MGRTPKLIKVCLTNQGEDSETPWAEDLGPARNGTPRGSRKVRLVNVPFLHAKPTWGDIIVVSPVEDGLPTWDAGGVAWSKIGTRILDDSGRHAMIVDYAPPPGDASGNAAFRALFEACKAIDVVCEGCFGPRDGRPGRAYLAVPDELSPSAVMKQLGGAKLPARLTQIHPAPRKARSKPKPKTKPRRATRATRRR